MSGVEMVSVEGFRDIETFIELPWKIYQDDPNWVPPLKSVVRRMLDEQHPFWEFSERILLLARRNSETVGRIAGIVDKNYNQFHNTGMGIWGFFECIDDHEISEALFAEVQKWVCQKGMTFLRGPLNPSTNYEVGLLTEGFEHRPTFMMPYNPPYYRDLVESAGFRKEKELVSYIVDRSWKPPEWMQRLADRLKSKGSISVRSANKKNLGEEVALIKHIYDESWNQNWGYVPMTDAEAEEMAGTLVKFADPELIFFIYVNQEPVAVGLVVPDICPLLKRLNGKVGLLGLLKILLYRKEVNGMRGLLFGIKEEYRQLGLPFVGFDYLFRVATYCADLIPIRTCSDRQRRFPRKRRESR
ncbi:MAG: acyl-CoA N-acyltransferase [Deltaproteobacteria bacterium]